MAEDSLALKVLEYLQKEKKQLVSEKEIQQAVKISFNRQNELKKSLQILEETKMVKKFPKSEEKLIYLPKKETKESEATQETKESKETIRKSIGSKRISETKQKRKSMRGLQVSVSPSSKYKLTEKTTIQDLPNERNELQLLKVELLCKKKRLEEKLRESEMKAKSNKKCEGKNLDAFTKKWKMISRELLYAIQKHCLYSTEHGERVKME